MLMNHVCLPLPPCPRGSMERGGGTSLGLLMGRGRLPPIPSLRRGGPPQPQPDPLDDKLPSSPIQFRPKISSVHHMDDWGVDGEDRAPSPASPQPQARGKREERERAIDHTQAADFYEKSARRRSPPRERPQPHGHNRHSAPARPRFPPVRALPVGGSRIHWGLIRPYDAHAEFGEHVARPRDEAARHNSVASLVWQQAEARNRSRAREPDAPSASYPRLHQRSDSSDRPRSWAPQLRTSIIQPLPSDPHHRATQPPGHTEPLGHRAARHALDHPARDRPYEAQRHSTAPPAHTSRARITAGVLLRCPREAETRQFTQSRTSRILRPARAGPTHLHTRLPAMPMTPFWDTTGAASRNIRSLHTALIRRSRLPPTRLNLNPRRRETSLTPGLPRRETSTTTAQSPSLLTKTNRISRSQPS